MSRLTIYLTVFLIITIQACGPKMTKIYEADPITASGEFLFEGPNTLQGKLTTTIKDVCGSLGLHYSDINSAEVSSLTLRIVPDSLRNEVESVLVQLVSDELPLVSVGTLSPLMDQKEQTLKTSGDVNILPYLKDETSMVIVDANLSSDLDELATEVIFTFELKH